MNFHIFARSEQDLWWHYRIPRWHRIHYHWDETFWNTWQLLCSWIRSRIWQETWDIRFHSGAMTLDVCSLSAFHTAKNPQLFREREREIERDRERWNFNFDISYKNTVFEGQVERKNIQTEAFQQLLHK